LLAIRFLDFRLGGFADCWFAFLLFACRCIPRPSLSGSESLRHCREDQWAMVVLERLDAAPKLFIKRCLNLTERHVRGHI
jgi:hypothetical protein